ncbi:recombinase family protein [Microvirga flavescens]|uniref:recombinase family protein n=1 Tax=Microvirga flavescens TaxID=2249811 RepID=UPI000DD9C4FF|nr:recombinase family protein [Microvirga flavescens]
MAAIGYCRVSHLSQDYASQEARLRAHGCEIVRAEKVSGKSREGRDELASILEFIREGDELVCVRLDRLGRSTRDVLNLVHELQAKGASLRILEPAFSTNEGTGMMLVTVLGMVAEMERQFLAERQKVGIEAAKKRGVYKGRKASVPVNRIQEMKAAGHRPSAIAKELGISRMSVHRALKNQQANLAIDYLPDTQSLS